MSWFLLSLIAIKCIEVLEWIRESLGIFYGKLAPLMLKSARCKEHARSDGWIECGRDGIVLGGGSW